MNILKSVLFISILFQTAFALAGEQPVFLRWTGKEDGNAEILHVLKVLGQKTKKSLPQNHFLLQENRDLANTHFQKYQQLAGGYPVEGKSIRIWTSLATGKLVQLEAALDLDLLPTPGKESFLRFRSSGLNEIQMFELVRDSLSSSSEDASVRDLNWSDRVQDGQLVRIYVIKSKRGKHRVVVSHSQGKVISKTYEEFPQADIELNKSKEIEALVYPIYEEVEGEGTILTREKKMLTNLNTTVASIQGDVYAPLKKRRYFEFQFSPILGMTEEGRAQGYWAMAYVKQRAALIRGKLPQVQNDFGRGMLLHGKYATINIHPDAIREYQPDFAVKPSSPFFPNWVPVQVDGKVFYEMIPGSGFYGKPIRSASEAMNRLARRLPDHDPMTYLNDGFDEIQVYYAVNTFMEELQARGMTDPELSTRPFNAFLFNPDVEYRDNAFYIDDSINFTTYSDKQPNMARDNSTIWHELGHGIMDRLMGENIRLADTGGLSEGMADFLAQIIVQAVTGNRPFPGSEKFRIINQTGFFLTNEVHDDGEAYGGAMNDFMMAIVNREGAVGLKKVTDVILEAMRLCRDHPALTAKDWFEHVLFADELGRPGLRTPGELSSYLLTALNGRNFQLDGSSSADMKLVNLKTGTEVVAGAEGSRGNAIPVIIPKTGKAHFDLGLTLKSVKNYGFRYPLTIKVEFEKGALQGAIHWVGKENGPKLITLRSEADMATIPLDVTGTCDYSNRQDGSCVDYAYVQILNKGESMPRAKKRFYLQIKNP